MLKNIFSDKINLGYISGASGLLGLTLFIVLQTTNLLKFLDSHFILFDTFIILTFLILPVVAFFAGTKSLGAPESHGASKFFATAGIIIGLGYIFFGLTFIGLVGM